MSANVLIVEEEAKQTILDFLTKVIALASAISSAIVLVMTYFECIRKRIKQRIRGKTDAKKNNNTMELMPTAAPASFDNAVLQ